MQNLFLPKYARHPDNATRLAVWRPFLIFHKKFVIIYIQCKGKNKYSTLEKLKNKKEDIIMSN